MECTIRNTTKEFNRLFAAAFSRTVATVARLSHVRHSIFRLDNEMSEWKIEENWQPRTMRTETHAHCSYVQFCSVRTVLVHYERMGSISNEPKKRNVDSVESDASH